MKNQLSTSEFEDILIYFTNSILGKNSEDEIAWDLAKNCISQLGFTDCVVYFADHDKKILVQKSAYGPKNPDHYRILSPITIPIGQGITGSAAASGKTELVADTSKDHRYIIDDEVRLSELCVPIVIDNQVFGVIDCEHPEKNFFTSQHAKILSAIASVCAMKIKNVKSEREILEKQQHLLDTKTELLSLKIKALRAQMNPHFVFNAINAIQYFITINDKRTSLSYLSTFSKLIRYHLNYFELDEVSIDTEIQMLKWYLKLQKLRYDEKFDYTIDAQLDNSQSTKKIPSMVLASIIENVIENSVINQQDEIIVHISITRQDETLLFNIKYKSIKSNRTRKITYRDEMTDWEEQIDLWNRLRNLNIEKKISTHPSENQNDICFDVAVTLPILETYA